MAHPNITYSPTYNQDKTRTLHRAIRELGNLCSNDKVREVAFKFAFSDADEDTKTILYSKFGQQVFLKQIEKLFNNSEESVTTLAGKIFKQAEQEMEFFPKMTRPQLAIEYYKNTYPNFNWVLDFVELALEKAGYNRKYERHNRNWTIYMEDSLYISSPYQCQLYDSFSAIRKEIKNWSFVDGKIQEGKLPVSLEPKKYRSFDWKLKRLVRSNAEAHTREYIMRISAFLNFPTDEQAEPEDKVIIQFWLDRFSSFESLYRRAENLLEEKV